MNRSKLNVIIDAVAFCEFVLLAATGVFIEYVLPPRTGRFLTVFGLNRHDWGTIHFWIAVVFFATLALHLMLHWKWIVALVRGRQRESSGGFRVALAVVGLVALLALAATPFVASVEQSTEVRGAGAGVATRDISHQILGSMTLREVADKFSLPPTVLISDLDLPADTSPDERLGRLSRRHNRPIEEMRRAIEQSLAEHR